MAWVAVGAAAIGAVGGAYSSRQNKKAAEQANQAASIGTMADPRIADRLFGANGQGGLLNQFDKVAEQPQSAGLLSYGQGQDAYLGANGLLDMAAMRDSANGLMNSNIAAPQATAAQAPSFQNGPAAQMAASLGQTSHGQASNGQASHGGVSHMQAAQAATTPGINTYGADVLWNKGETYSAPDAMKAAQVGAPGQVSGATVNQPMGMAATMANGASVNAPAQNGMDLSGSYDRFINAKPGENQFLKQSTDGAIAQNRLGFQQMLDDSTRNLNENVLGGIRSNSIISGQYGGSRQGIAEGRAIGDTQREQARAASMFGQNATNASVGAQSQAYESDSNRALSATQGLGAQQYGVAQQNAGQQQQAGLQNAAASTQAAATNYGGLLSGEMANAGFDQQAALSNQGANLAASTTNAGLTQNANQTNYTGQLGVNAGNASNLQQANLANQNAGNNASQFNATQQQGASAANAQLTQNNSQFNANALTGASQFNAGQNQASSQFNAGQNQAASLFNANQNQSNSQFNAGQNQATNLFNANQSQGANQFNAGMDQQNNLFNTSLLSGNGQFNANMTQQAGLANQSSLLNTNALNSNNQQAGLAASSGLLGTALQGAQNQDNYALTRAGAQNSLLQPYLSRNPAPQQQLTTSTAGNVFGGAAAGMGLLNMYNKVGGASNSYTGATGTAGIGGTSMNLSDLDGWKTSWGN